MANGLESQAEILCRVLVDEFPGPAGILDVRGRVHLANSAFCRAFGLDPVRAEGTEMDTVLTPASSAWLFFNDRLENALDSQEALAFDLTFTSGTQPMRLNLKLKRVGDWFLLTEGTKRVEASTQADARDDESALRYAEIKRCPPALVALVQKALGDFISRITSLLKARDIRQFSSQLHGLKGTTLMVGLKSIAARVHALETELAHPGATGKFQAGDFDKVINDLTQDMAETRRLFDVLPGLQNASTSHGDVYDSIQRLFTKYDQLISGRPSFGARIAAERIDWAIRSVNRSPVSDLREFFMNQIARAAEATGKKVEVDWQSEALPIDEDSRKILVEIFTHVATNSVVHGLESESERQARGKPDTGRVRVMIHFDGAVVQGTIADDGQGIDPQKIKARALEKGLRSADALAALDDDGVCRLIFEHGFSTTTEVDKLSGRGVGLDAVLLALSRGDGDIRIHSEVGTGTEFRFWFRPPTGRASVKKLLTYKALHNQLMGVTAYQAEQERLAVHLDEELENASSIETGMVYADEVPLMAAISGLTGQLAARSACEIKMRVTPQGQVQLSISRQALPNDATLPEQYTILKDTFAEWIRLSGGSAAEGPDGSILITLGGAMTAEHLPLLELQSTPDLIADDFAAVFKAVEVAGRSLGFEVAKADSPAPAAKPKLVLLATYANYDKKPGEVSVHYQQHPAEIKSTLIAAMENVLKAA